MYYKRMPSKSKGTPKKSAQEALALSEPTHSIGQCPADNPSAGQHSVVTNSSSVSRRSAVSDSPSPAVGRRSGVTHSPEVSRRGSAGSITHIKRSESTLRAQSAGQRSAVSDSPLDDRQDKIASSSELSPSGRERTTKKKKEALAGVSLAKHAEIMEAPQSSSPATRSGAPIKKGEPISGKRKRGIPLIDEPQSKQHRIKQAGKDQHLPKEASCGSRRIEEDSSRQLCKECITDSVEESSKKKLGEGGKQLGNRRNNKRVECTCCQQAEESSSKQLDGGSSKQHGKRMSNHLADGKGNKISENNEEQPYEGSNEEQLVEESSKEHLGEGSSKQLDVVPSLRCQTAERNSRRSVVVTFGTDYEAIRDLDLNLDSTEELHPSARSPSTTPVPGKSTLAQGSVESRGRRSMSTRSGSTRTSAESTRANSPDPTPGATQEKRLARSGLRIRACQQIGKKEVTGYTLAAVGESSSRGSVLLSHYCQLELGSSCEPSVARRWLARHHMDVALEYCAQCPALSDPELLSHSTATGHNFEAARARFISSLLDLPQGRVDNCPAKSSGRQPTTLLLVRSPTVISVDVANKLVQELPVEAAWFGNSCYVIGPAVDGNGSADVFHMDDGESAVHPSLISIFGEKRPMTTNQISSLLPRPPSSEFLSHMQTAIKAKLQNSPDGKGSWLLFLPFIKEEEEEQWAGRQLEQELEHHIGAFCRVRFLPGLEADWPYRMYLVTSLENLSTNLLLKCQYLAFRGRPVYFAQTERYLSAGDVDDLLFENSSTGPDKSSSVPDSSRSFTPLAEMRWRKNETERRKSRLSLPLRENSRRSTVVSLKTTNTESSNSESALVNKDIVADVEKWRQKAAELGLENQKSKARLETLKAEAEDKLKEEVDKSSQLLERLNRQAEQLRFAEDRAMELEKSVRTTEQWNKQAKNSAEGRMEAQKKELAKSAKLADQLKKQPEKHAQAIAVLQQELTNSQDLLVLNDDSLKAKEAEQQANQLTLATLQSENLQLVSFLETEQKAKSSAEERLRQLMEVKKKKETESQVAVEKVEAKVQTIEETDTMIEAALMAACEKSSRLEEDLAKAAVDLADRANKIQKLEHALQQENQKYISYRDNQAAELAAQNLVIQELRTSLQQLKEKRLTSALDQAEVVVRRLDPSQLSHANLAMFKQYEAAGPVGKSAKLTDEVKRLQTLLQKEKDMRLKAETQLKTIIEKHVKVIQNSKLMQDNTQLNSPESQLTNGAADNPEVEDLKKKLAAAEYAKSFVEQGAKISENARKEGMDKWRILNRELKEEKKKLAEERELSETLRLEIASLKSKLQAEKSDEEEKAQLLLRTEKLSTELRNKDAQLLGDSFSKDKGLEELKEKLLQAEYDLTEARNEISALQQKVISVKLLLSSSNQAYLAGEERLAKLKGEIEEKDGLIRSQEDLEAKTLQLEDFEAGVSDMVLQHDNDEKQLGGLRKLREEHGREMQEEIRKYNELAKAKEELAKEKETLMAKISELEMQKEVGQVEQPVATMNQQRGVLERRIAELEEQNKLLNDQLSAASAKEEKERLVIEISELKFKNNTQGERLTELEAQESRRSAEPDKEKQLLNESIAKLEKQNQEAKNKLSSTAEQLTNTEILVTELKEKIADLEIALVDRSKEVASSKSDLEQLGKEKAELARQLEEQKLKSVTWREEQEAVADATAADQTAEVRQQLCNKKQELVVAEQQLQQVADQLQLLQQQTAGLINEDAEVLYQVRAELAEEQGRIAALTASQAELTTRLEQVLAEKEHLATEASRQKRETERHADCFQRIRQLRKENRKLIRSIQELTMAHDDDDDFDDNDEDEMKIKRLKLEKRESLQPTPPPPRLMPPSPVVREPNTEIESPLLSVEDSVTSSHTAGTSLIEAAADDAVISSDVLDTVAEPSEQEGALNILRRAALGIPKASGESSQPETTTDADVPVAVTEKTTSEEVPQETRGEAPVTDQAGVDGECESSYPGEQPVSAAETVSECSRGEEAAAAHVEKEMTEALSENLVENESGRGDVAPASPDPPEDLDGGSEETVDQVKKGEEPREEEKAMDGPAIAAQEENKTENDGLQLEGPVNSTESGLVEVEIESRTSVLVGGENKTGEAANEQGDDKERKEENGSLYKDASTTPSVVRPAGLILKPTDELLSPSAKQRMTTSASPSPSLGAPVSYHLASSVTASSASPTFSMAAPAMSGSHQLSKRVSGSAHASGMVSVAAAGRDPQQPPRQRIVRAANVIEDAPVAGPMKPSTAPSTVSKDAGKPPPRPDLRQTVVQPGARSYEAQADNEIVSGLIKACREGIREGIEEDGVGGMKCEKCQHVNRSCPHCQTKLFDKALVMYDSILESEESLDPQLTWDCVSTAYENLFGYRPPKDAPHNRDRTPDRGVAKAEAIGGRQPQQPLGNRTVVSRSGPVPPLPPYQSLKPQPPAPYSQQYPPPQPFPSQQLQASQRQQTNWSQQQPGVRFQSSMQTQPSTIQRYLYQPPLTQQTGISHVAAPMAPFTTVAPHIQQTTRSVAAARVSSLTTAPQQPQQSQVPVTTQYHMQQQQLVAGLHHRQNVIQQPQYWQSAIQQPALPSQMPQHRGHK